MDSVTLDVREDIRNGVEPFGKIMEAVQNLKAGQRLVLINSFEPKPLYRVLEAEGFAHRAEELENGDWRITFFKNGD